eukprot:scaffold1622_cov114-Skeletonema_menzelii.AAC.4
MIKSNTFNEIDKSVEVAAANLARDAETGDQGLDFDIDDGPVDAATSNKMRSFCSGKGCYLVGGLVAGAVVGFASGGASARKAGLIQMQAAPAPKTPKSKAPKSKAPKSSGAPANYCECMVGTTISDSQHGLSIGVTRVTTTPWTLDSWMCAFEVEMTLDQDQSVNTYTMAAMYFGDEKFLSVQGKSTVDGKDIVAGGGGGIWFDSWRYNLAMTDAAANTYTTFMKGSGVITTPSIC